MSVTANKRIDAGIKRGPKKAFNRQPQAASTGRFEAKVTPEVKATIIAGAYDALQAGETTEQIASRYGITGRALRYWLLDDDRAEDARRSMITSELARTGEDLRNARYADSPLPLACAREEARYWQWMADRRDARYAQRHEVALSTSVTMSPAMLVSATQLLERALGRTLDGVAEDVTDVTDEIVNHNLSST